MKTILPLLITISSFQLALTQESGIITEISRDTILLGNTSEVRFTANNLEVKFEGPEFEKLQVVSGPNVSTSMQFINGKMTSSLSYNYIFYPQDIGEYYISPAYFNAQDTVYETPPISLIVLPNPSETKQSKGAFKVVDHQTYKKKNIGDPKSDVLRKKKEKDIMSRTLLLFFVFILCTLDVQGQILRFYAATDASVSNPATREYQVLQNSVFEISFTLENGDGNSFIPPSFNGLQVIRGPSTSTQVSIINGRRSQKKSYSFSVLGINPGTYRIASASINTDQGKLKSDPFIVVVSKTVANELSKTSYIDAQASDTIAFIGQQIIVKYQLITQENIKSYEAISNFEFDGFFVRELDDVSRRPQRIIKDGQEYFSTTLEAVSLFPQQTGTYTIPSIAIRVGIPKPSRRRSLFSFQEYDYKVINSKPIVITINDLPISAPLSFSGAVGHYTATFETDKKTLSTDQSLNLKLSIRGDGDNKHIIPPIMDLGEDFEVYEPNTLRDESYVSGAKVVNYKVFEYLIVPDNPGQYQIKPEFSYFNVDSNKYETIYPHYPFQINVTKGQNIAADITSITNRNLRPNKPASQLSKSQWGFMGSASHLSILSVLFLGILGMITHQYWQIRETNLDPAIKAKRKARKIAIKRLETANSFMEAKNERAFYDEISKTILHYLEDKLNISTGSLTKDNLNDVIEQQGLDQLTIEKISGLLKSAELALFAGGSSENLEKTYTQAQSIIEEIEDCN